MNQVLGGLYRAVLLLLPRRFREEFGEEMAEVFEQSMRDAAAQGKRAQLKTAWSELGGLLLESARQVLQRRGKRAPRPPVRPPARKEIILGLALFGVPALALTLEGSAALQVRSGLILLLSAVLLAGFLRGLPRWSLPYLGLSTATGAFVVLFQSGADRVSHQVLARLGWQPEGESALLLMQAAWAGLAWLMLFVVICAVLVLLAWVGRFGCLFASLRQDWTQVSYILYGGALAELVLAPFMAGKTYPPGQKVYLLLAVSGMALGAWFYLVAEQPLQKWIALLAGLSLALTACAAGGLPLLPFLENVGMGTRRPLLEWAWMAVILLAPAALNLFSARDGPGQAC